MTLMTLLACACHNPSEPPPPVAAAPEPEPVDELTAVHRALSSRDAPPSCDQVEALTSDPVATLTTILREHELPPQAPMRAAACLIEGHAEAVADELVAWMSSEADRGLALLVVQRLDDLPLGVAVRVAEAGLGGPVHQETVDALAESERPELQALQP